MKKIAIVFCTLLYLVILNQGYAEETTELSRIDTIEVHVISSEVMTIQNESSLTKAYKAATASQKNEHCIPYERVGKIWRIALNPSWTPTGNIQKEYAAKNRPLPKTIPPGKNNPLGKIKIFISFDGNNSLLGIHGTNEPRSIGRRVTHGCVRIGANDIFELAKTILEQDGHDAQKLFQTALKNPIRTISVNIGDGPSVLFLRN